MCCPLVFDRVCATQFELYSSRVRDFEVLGRQSHPRADGSDYAKSLNASSWQPLGRFTAANVKGMQARPLGTCPMLQSPNVLSWQPLGRTMAAIIKGMQMHA